MTEKTSTTLQKYAAATCHISQCRRCIPLPKCTGSEQAVVKRDFSFQCFCRYTFVAIFLSEISAYLLQKMCDLHQILTASRKTQALEAES